MSTTMLAAVRSDPTRPDGPREPDATASPGPVEPEARLRRGTELGRYLVLEHVGTGGMGSVYAAYDPELDRRVALKLLSSPRRDEPPRAPQLLAEGRALARLVHPNVVMIHDVGRWGDDVFIAMEYVRGRTLGDWLARESPTLEQVLAHYVAAGRGLAAAHAEDIVHGDFKPANVMVADDGRVVVLDFGLARPAPPAPSADSSSARPRAMPDVGGGTPAYMAPEQHHGGAPDPRSDQYSFCVALYEAAGGSRLHPAPPQVTAPSLPPEDPVVFTRGSIPRWLWRVLRRGLQADPAARFPSLDALLRALDPARRRSRRRWLRIGAVGLLAGAGLVAQGVEPEPCRDALAPLDGVWDPLRRAALDRRWHAHAPWPEVRTQLDGLAARWRSHWEQACRATHVERTQSPSLLDRRMACLHQHRGQLDAFVQQLSTGDDAVLSRAAELVGALDAGARCADVPSMLTRAPPPADPDARRAFDHLIADVHANMMLTGLASRPHEAIAALDALESRADRLAHPRARRLVAQARGHALERLDRAEPAAAAYAHALTLAEAAGDDHAALELASTLVHVFASILEDPGRGEAWAAVADAKLARLGAHATAAEEVGLLIHRATLARARGDLDEAIAMLERALKRAEPDDVARRGAIHNNRGIILHRLGATERADDALRTAIELRTRAFGADHWRVAQSRYHRARVLTDRGQLDAAELALQQALDAFARGEESPREAILAEDARAVIAATRGDLPVALERGRRALARAEVTLGEDAPLADGLRFNLGRTLLLAERFDEAHALVERTVADVERRHGRHHAPLAENLSLLGQIELARGRPVDAIPRLERAAAITASDAMRLRLEVAVLYARALVDCDLDGAVRRARARLRARQSQPGMTPALASVVDELERELKRWTPKRRERACQPLTAERTRPARTR